MGHDLSSPGIENQRRRPRSRAGFGIDLLSRHQLRASASRRAAWYSWDERQRRSPVRGCGNATGLTSILDRWQVY